MTRQVDFYKQMYNLTTAEMLKVVASDTARRCTKKNLQALQNYQQARIYLYNCKGVKVGNPRKKSTLTLHIDKLLRNLDEKGGNEQRWCRIIESFTEFYCDPETIYPLEVNQELVNNVISADVLNNALYRLPNAERLKRFLMANKVCGRTDVKVLMRQIKKKLPNSYKPSIDCKDNPEGDMLKYMENRKIILEQFLSEALKGPTEYQLYRMPYELIGLYKVLTF